MGLNSGQVVVGDATRDLQHTKALLGELE